MKEAVVEQAAFGWFEALGFETDLGTELSPGGSLPSRSSFEQVVLETRLKPALRRLNAHLPEELLRSVADLVQRPPEPTLEQNNRWFHRLLTDGVNVEYRSPEGERGGKAWLVDFDEPKRNDFLVARQLTVTSPAGTRRPDLVLFINGLPMVVIELKDPANEGADVWAAFRQLRDYRRVIPSLFVYNELLVASDGLITRVGTLTADQDRFSPWRSSSDHSTAGGSPLEALILDLCDPAQFLDYIRYCVVFDEDERTGTITKRSAGYHQFRAVQAGRDAIRTATKPGGDGRGGVVWHTQGSGKSLTMLMLAGALVADPAMANPTIVVVTDRNDLDDQLFSTFAGGRELLRQPPEQAESRDDLAKRLNRASGGVIFTTIQKFAEREGAVCERNNVVVLADEAHRSQYGFLDGGARWMREALPNATFVGFTGTPLELDDRSTPAVFGSYIDIYDIRQAITDEATVPIYYEMRLVRLVPDDSGIDEAERRFVTALAADAEGGSIEPHIDIALEALVGARPRLQVVAAEIVDHFEKRRSAIEGKAMVVCMSRSICMDLYDEIVALRPEWDHEDDDQGFVKVVMTGHPSEGERIAHHARSKSRRQALARRFKDPEDDLRLVIVCDMWLTGFDCPPLHTLYLDKPLAGHNLMQAIARVNRVFGEKPGGVIVDFLGLADQLRAAIDVYTDAGGHGKPVQEIQEAAVPVMQRDHEALQAFFDGFDYGNFVALDEAEQLRAVAAGTDYVLEQLDGEARFLNLVARLSKAFALCVPLPETEAVRDDLALFQAIRAAMRKRLLDSGPPPDDNRLALREVIAGTIRSEGVIDLFEAAGLHHPNVSIFSDQFLDQLAGLPQQHVALEALRKLIQDEIHTREQVNLVQSRSFRESLTDVLARYANRALTTTQVIEELIALAREMREALQRGEAAGLTPEEQAFYDALADNASAREVLQNETLEGIARELAARIRQKATLDWTQREAVRADMRRTIRRLLARYGYPPDAQDSATQLVLRQAELLATARFAEGE